MGLNRLNNTETPTQDNVLFSIVFQFSRLISVEFNVNLCTCARFGIGRFTTEEEVDYTADKCIQQVQRLREMR